LKQHAKGYEVLDWWGYDGQSDGYETIELTVGFGVVILSTRKPH
jgi:hypothetical protein